MTGPTDPPVAVEAGGAEPLPMASECAELPTTEPDGLAPVDRVAEGNTRDAPGSVSVSVTIDAEDDSLDVEVELIFGVTRAVGTPADTAMEQLRNSLSNYGYEVATVKVSDLLRDSLQSDEKWPDVLDESQRVNLLIEEGNRLNVEAEREDELAVRAVNEIQDLRRQHANSEKNAASPSRVSASEARTATAVPRTIRPATVALGNAGSADYEPLRLGDKSGSGTVQRGVEADESTTEVSRANQPEETHPRTSARRAYIVDSLKRPREVALMREIYGDHFILIGLQASADVRENLLVSKLSTQGKRDNARELAQALMERDNHEQVEHQVLENGKILSYGQDMLVTFPMSDVFINVDSDDDATRQVRRAVQLLFGDPEADGPDLCELGLNLATQTAARSTELGLRVGAVIMNNLGDVLAVGTNRHPIETSSPDFDAGALDIRQLVQATMSYLMDADILAPGEKVKLEENPDDYVRGLLGGVLADSDLKGLTEYQRAVHAEMDALISAVRQRVDLAGACVYVTNYPCHGCAKHLIALGLQVVYLEPYAKGKAESMYGDATLTFVPFTGVAPRRFEAWFVVGRSADRKDKSGIKIHWGPQQKAEAVPNVTSQISMVSKHLREKFAIRR